MKNRIIVTLSAVVLGSLLASCSEIIGASVATSCATHAVTGVASLGSKVSNAIDSHSAKSKAKRNNANLNALKIGQTKAEVVAIMGSADRRDAIELKSGEMVDICLYRSEAGVATSNEFESIYISLSIGGESSPKEKYTPLIFKQDKLVGWGRSFYEQIQSKAKVG